MDSEPATLSPEPGPPEAYAEELDTGILVNEAWQIGDIPTADWALGRVADLEREIAENERVAELAISRIRMRTEALNTRAQRGVGFFKGRIAAFAQANRELLLKGGKRKTRAMLHGSIAWRSTPQRLGITDPAALLDWCRLQPAELGLVRIKEDVSKSAVNEYFEKTGDIPPGAELEPSREEVLVRAEMGERDANH